MQYVLRTNPENPGTVYDKLRSKPQLLFAKTICWVKQPRESNCQNTEQTLKRAVGAKKEAAQLPSDGIALHR